MERELIVEIAERDRLNNFTRLVGIGRDRSRFEYVLHCGVERKKPDDRACLINFTWRQVYTRQNPYGDWFKSTNKSPRPYETGRLPPNSSSPWNSTIFQSVLSLARVTRKKKSLF